MTLILGPEAPRWIRVFTAFDLSPSEMYKKIEDEYSHIEVSIAMVLAKEIFWATTYWQAGGLASHRAIGAKRTLLNGGTFVEESLSHEIQCE